MEHKFVATGRTPEGIKYYLDDKGQKYKLTSWTTKQGESRLLLKKLDQPDVNPPEANAWFIVLFVLFFVFLAYLVRGPNGTWR